MKIFIVGSYHTFTTELIQFFHKEGDKVYVLHEDNSHTRKPRGVFEQYHFSYLSDSITEILDSVRPDAVIYTGAYDTGFSWSNVRNESMHFISGLINLLIASDLHHVKQFIYLSSHEVYQANSDTPILETNPTTPRDYKGIAIAQGEELCRQFQETTNLEVSILRLSHLYQIPENGNEIHDLCSSMCLEALRTGTIRSDAKKIISMIYSSDAVYGIFQFLHTPGSKKLYYHLTGETAISQKEIADLIAEEDPDIMVLDHTVGITRQTVLDGNSFNREFHFSISHSYQKTIPMVYRSMKKRSKKFLTREELERHGSKFRFLRQLKPVLQAFFPYLENLLLFIPVFMINNRAVGSQYFDKLDFFVLYVLLFAGIYGTKQAVFSAVLSVAGYCFRQLYNRTGIDLLIDYNTYLWIAQLFIIGMSVGRLRDSTRTISQEKEEEIQYLNHQLTDLIDINNSNNRIKNIYQDRIIDYDDSLVKIYKITSELDTQESGAVLFYAANIIGNLLGTKDVAIYQVANNDYCRLFSATSANAKTLGKSLKYSEMTELISAFSQHQVYVNRTMDPEYPMMASAIYRNEKPAEIIMLWGLKLENMTQYHCNLLTVLGYMIYNSVERANRYLDALSTTRFVENTRFLAPDAFEELRSTYHDAMKKGFTEYTILEIVGGLQATYREWSDILSKKLRLSDYLGIDNTGKMYILLTNSNNSDASFIIQRFQEQGIICSILEQ